jgi:hypothetical protein
MFYKPECLPAQYWIGLIAPHRWGSHHISHPFRKGGQGGRLGYRFKENPEKHVSTDRIGTTDVRRFWSAAETRELRTDSVLQAGMKTGGAIVVWRGGLKLSGRVTSNSFDFNFPNSRWQRISGVKTPAGERCFS